MMPEVAPTPDARRSVEGQHVHGGGSCGGQRRKGDPEAVDTRVDVDRGLVESLRLGESSAVEQLLTIYGNRAYRLAIRISGSERDAEEIVQDAFWAVIRRVDTFRGDAAFGSWLYRIVANAAYQKLRARRRERSDVSLDDVLPFFDERGQHVAPMADWSTRLADRSVQTELRMTLTSALEELPAAGRAVLWLHDVEGLSAREIAETLNMKVASVKSRVHRARLFLRKRLGGAVLGSDTEAGGER
ncbi:MAG TPA: RNA polymerase sigma factor [Gemmatimonadales bacterium]|nr:RNA polymerase sigma factor [Gemmatimonadales bacterium]